MSGCDVIHVDTVCIATTTVWLTTEPRNLQGYALCGGIVNYVPIAGASLERCAGIVRLVTQEHSEHHNLEDQERYEKRGKCGVRVVI